MVSWKPYGFKHKGMLLSLDKQQKITISVNKNWLDKAFYHHAKETCKKTGSIIYKWFIMANLSKHKNIILLRKEQNENNL